MEVRISLASAVVIQWVSASGSDWFMECRRGISASAEAFAGYRGSDVYPPIVKNGNGGSCRALSDRDVALTRSGAFCTPPGAGGSDAGRKRSKRGHPEMGCHANVEHHSGAMAQSKFIQSSDIACFRISVYPGHSCENGAYFQTGVQLVFTSAPSPVRMRLKTIYPIGLAMTGG